MKPFQLITHYKVVALAVINSELWLNENNKSNSEKKHLFFLCNSFGHRMFWKSKKGFVCPIPNLTKLIDDEMPCRI